MKVVFEMRQVVGWREDKNKKKTSTEMVQLTKIRELLHLMKFVNHWFISIKGELLEGGKLAKLNRDNFTRCYLQLVVLSDWLSVEDLLFLENHLLQIKIAIDKLDSDNSKSKNHPNRKIDVTDHHKNEHFLAITPQNGRDAWTFRQVYPLVHSYQLLLERITLLMK
jgi:hypothetical protein